MTGNTNLAKLEGATRMLAEIRTVDDAKTVINLAEAARIYARQVGLGLEAQNHAAEIKLRAQRRAGEILAQMEKHPAGRPTDNRSQPVTDLPPKLEDLGIGRMDSSRWQQVATLTEEVFEQHIADTKAGDRELTTTSMLRIAKEEERESIREVNRALVKSGRSVPLERIGRYPTLVIDPPWDWGDEGDADQYGRARPKYGTMSIDEIAALPISELAEHDSHLYLWITNRSLPKGFALLERWGFRHVTTLTWCKPSIGMGNYFRGSTEHILFAVRGSLPLLRNDVGTWFAAPRSASHSDKPEELYRIVETCSPGPWLEMFSRRERPGWAVWGAEV